MTGSLYDCLLFSYYPYFVEIDIENCYLGRILIMNLFMRWCVIYLWNK